MSEMLQEGTISLNEQERAAVDKLGDGVVGYTREGDLLIVTVGTDEYEVAEDGKRKKVT